MTRAHRRVRLYSLGTALMFLAGCGGSERGARSSEACPEALRGYPSSTHMVATGGGATLKDAERAAQAELASQISARLSAELTISASQSTSGAERQEVTQDLRVSSSFAHAELMKTAPACSRCSTNGCEATVTLDRDEAATRIIKELGPDVDRLTTALKDLTLSSPLLTFTPAWHVARGAYERLRPQLNQLEVIGRLPKALSGVDSALKASQRTKAQRLQRLAVWVYPLQAMGDTGPLSAEERAPIEAALRERLNASIEQVGLRVWGQSRCPTGLDLEVLVVAPTAKQSCTLGYVGPQCALELAVELSLCPSEAEPSTRSLSSAEWSALKLIGVHPQDEAEALKRLVASITRKDLTPHLARLLAPFVPF